MARQETEEPLFPEAQVAVPMPSGRRKHGTVQKPPAAAPHVDIDLTDDASMADWSDDNFKSKWEKLKADYGIWKRLMKETGLGWVESKKNIIMPEAWWKKMSKDIKGSGRSKERGLQNEEHLEVMFEVLHNTGDDHWCASSGLPPIEPNPSCDTSPNNLNDDENKANDDDSEPEEVTPSKGSGKRSERANVNRKGKKPKTAVGHWFQEQLGALVGMSERTTASVESIARREDKSGSSIKEVTKLVKECGATCGTNEHFVASLVFTKRAEREMFMTLDTNAERFEWLTRKHDWMTRNDVAK